MGGAIFARERSDRAGEVGVPPPTVGSFLIFRLENVQSGHTSEGNFDLTTCTIWVSLYGIENKPWFNFIWGARGVPPPTVGSFFIFRLENVQSGAYLRRKFRLDDMYYMGELVWN